MSDYMVYVKEENMVLVEEVNAAELKEKTKGRMDNYYKALSNIQKDGDK